MSRRGECYDNAIIETFFASLKNELFYVEKFESIEHLASEIHEYIRYYNNDRIRAKLNFMSPVQFRLLHYPLFFVKLSSGFYNFIFIQIGHLNRRYIIDNKRTAFFILVIIISHINYAPNTAR